MPEKYRDESCSRFAEDLASRNSVPGGGAGAAYAGAMGAALAQMVGNFTSGKRKYAEFEGDIERICAEAETVRGRLVELMDEDAQGFAPLARAYAIPKDDPTRDEVLQEATKGALACPMEVMRQCCKVTPLLEELLEKGSRMLVSDVGCAAVLCRSALEAASMNVFVNTAALADAALADGIDAECDAMLAEHAPRLSAVADETVRTTRRR